MQPQHSPKWMLTAVKVSTSGTRKIGEHSRLAENCPQAVLKGNADGCLKGGRVRRKGAVIAES